MEEVKEVQAEMPKKTEKMSYEQLESVAHQLSEQSRRLYMQLQEANQDNILSRLHYLFKVVKYRESFNVDFVSKCISEIEKTITVPEAENKAE